MSSSEKSDDSELDDFFDSKVQRKNSARKSTGGGSQVSSTPKNAEVQRKNCAKKSTSGSSQVSTPQANKITSSSGSLRNVPSTSFNDSENDWEPMPVNVAQSTETSSDSDSSEESGSESADSDQEVLLDVSVKKKRKLKKKTTKVPAKKQFKKPAPKREKSLSKKVVVPKSKEVIEVLVNKCVYYLLVADQKKHLIRRQGIIDHVFKDQAYDSTMFKEVLQKAKKVLEKTFGFELLCDKDQKDAYMIVNSLNSKLEVYEFSEHSDLKTRQRGLILYLLAIIFMNENPMHEDEVWKALKPLGIDATSRKPHPVFGDVKKFVGTELVKQMYLQSEVICKDPPTVEFLWGKRALLEVDKREILDFVCRVMNTKPEDYILPFKEAQECGR